MAEIALYNALETYNQGIENQYQKNWGSLLTFIGKRNHFQSFRRERHGHPHLQKSRRH